MVFAGWGSWVARFRWPVLIGALVAVIASGVWGLGVFGQLTEGGYNDPNSESTHAAQVVTDTFGAQAGDLVVIYTPVRGKIDDPQLAKRVKDSLAKLPKSAVTGTTSYWSAKSAQYAAKNKSSAVAVITLAGDDDAAKLDSYRAIDDKFAIDGAKVQLSGAMALADASSARSTTDLGKAEAISLPITLILLVLIFGSLVAASLPVLVGGASVLGSLGILHAISAGTDVNSFAVNVASLLGLGMAIDYGLFMVGRFREELADGRTPTEAVSRTVGTAGRTVVFSATLLMIALAGLLLFPQGFLNSLAYGGLAAVFLAALLSLTLLPALLAALGPRVDKLPVRLPRRPGQESRRPGGSWVRLAGVVLRHPVVVAAPILLILLLFASPIRSVHFGENDERILPAGDPSRQAIETLKADYPQFTGDSVQVVLRGAGDSAPFAVQLRQLPGISQIGSARRDKGVTFFTATLKTKDAYSNEARDVVDAIRALPVPAGTQLLVGGPTARNVDSIQATADKLPWMIAMLVGATLLLMFLAFGSVVLPIKAVLMSALSLCATFGLLVWIFQQGHGASLLDVTPAPLEVGIVVLMAAVVFGLSTDYEVFLLSRMVEARTRGASTGEAVTTGLARTGRVISAAALLLIVVTGAFALSAVTTMRFVGVGMIIALLLDATVVRMLLVPAVLRLLGDAAWWAPGPLRRLQQRAGLAEYEAPAAPAEPVAAAEPVGGRHAALDDTQVIRYVPDFSAEYDEQHALPSEYDEQHALPSGTSPLALPVGSLSADDATQVFARFEDTAVINIAGLAPLEEVEAETVDDSPAPRPSAEDDSIVDAEILDDDDPDMPAFAQAASAQPWELPPGSKPSPRTDWTVADDDGFFFGQAAEPSSYDTAWIPTSGEVSAEVAAMFAGDDAAALDESRTYPAAESFDEPAASFDEPAAPFDEPAEFSADSLVDAEPGVAASWADEVTSPQAITETEAAFVPEPEIVDEAFVSPDDIADAEVIDESAPGEYETVVDELENDEPVVADEPFDAELADVERDPEEPFVPEPRAKAIYRPFVPEPVVEADPPPIFTDPEPAFANPEPLLAAAESVFAPADEFETVEPPATVDVWDSAGRRPTSLADQMPARRSPNTVSRPADFGAYAQEPTSGLVEHPTPETDGPDGQTSTRRPATLGDQPLPRRPIPSLPEPQPMTEPEPQPPAAAAPAASAPADTPTPTSEPAPYAPPEVPAAYEVHEPLPLRAIPDVVAPRAVPTTPAIPNPPAQAPVPPAPPAQTPVPPAPTRVPSAQMPVPPAPAHIPAPPTPAQTPVLPVQTPVLPVQTAFPPAPMPPADAPTPAASRRPANLADHLRESRPADLSDYTTGRIPRMRRSSDEKPKAPRRPATLADHLSSRKAAEDSTHDLRDHANQD